MSQKLSNKIAEAMKIFSAHLFQQAIYISFDAPSPFIFDQHCCRACRACLQHATTSTYCRQTIRSGAYQALLTGEPYYFRCWLGINSFLVPVFRCAKLVGAVEIGGFLYREEADETDAFIATNLSNLPPALAAELRRQLRQIARRSPAEIRGDATFVYETLFAVGINNADDFRQRHEKYLIQRRIGELMQHHGASLTATPDIFDIFSALALALRRQDRDQVMRLLDDFFSRILLLSGLKIEPIKAQLHLLLSLLTRETVTSQQQPLVTAITQQHHIFRELEELQEIEDICYWAFVQVDHFLSAVNNPAPRPTSLADRVVTWIDENYFRKLSLDLAARHANSSSSAIIKHLKQETGKTFHQHLLGARLREARQLLANSALPLNEIALRCGFSDQSHFTRCFTKAFSLSPNRFRNLL